MVETHAERKIVVLGASGSIGQTVAKSLRERGADLLLAARDKDRLDALAQELTAESQLVDARDMEQVEGCVRRAAEVFGRVDGVVNCFGTLLLKPAHLTTPAEWRETIEVNLDSAFATLKGATKVMTKTGGSVVLISSAAARTGLANHEAIAAAKAGIEGLTRSAAASYAHRNIRVNAVAPGLVRSRLTERITSSEKALQNSQRMHALGRVGEPNDIASLIVWLLDPAHHWVTGQTFGVDGGLSAIHPRIS
jgi:NAD(P)-dependent dehydrogenase (short-subunit alcohol dehydrogenase family)